MISSMRPLAIFGLVLVFAWQAGWSADKVYIVVLGTAQDAGFPQAGCLKSCCVDLTHHAEQARSPSCLALVRQEPDQRWLFDATPQMPHQLKQLKQIAGPRPAPSIDGIFLTHAHIGHYSGLIHLGREVMGTKNLPVYAMPRMRGFLRVNGPWSQLVDLENIALEPILANRTIDLGRELQVTPIAVPHRDEFSETAGFVIRGPNKSVLYLPDIDKWDIWREPGIEHWLQKVDRAYLDGTFYADGELPGRDMSKIPHPFITESLARFSSLPLETRSKVVFIHLNHTNPALDPQGEAAKTIRAAGMAVAQPGERFQL